jgi:hypothetical protein
MPRIQLLCIWEREITIISLVNNGIVRVEFSNVMRDDINDIYKNDIV